MYLLLLVVCSVIFVDANNDSIFVDPTTKSSFHRIFGPEHKHLLISLLNSFQIPKIQDVSYLNNFETNSSNHEDIRMGIVAKTDSRSNFSIEIQIHANKTESLQHFLLNTTERTTGPPKIEPKGVHIVAILVHNKITNDSQYISHWKRRTKQAENDQKSPSNKLIIDLLSFTTVELEKFDTELPDELIEISDQWAYFLKFASDQDELDRKDIPKFKKEIQEAFRLAEIKNLSPVQRACYDQELQCRNLLKEQRDDELQRAFDDKVERESWRIKINTARTMKKDNVSLDIISKCTGLEEGYIKLL